MLTGRKLALSLAFTVLVAVAFGMSCNGFFPPNSLTAISIQPPSPQIEVGAANAQTLQAWGTYEDNSRSQITSGVEWTSSDDTVISIGLTTGLATGENVGGQATITAAAQGLSATASATAYLGSVSDLQLCTGTYNTGLCPAGTVFISATNGGTQDYYAKATYDGAPVDVTTVATWTVTPTATSGSVTCDNSASPAVCTVEPQTAPTGNYTITVTYPGTTAVTATITLD
jgi:hypothetical protein